MVVWKVLLLFILHLSLCQSAKYQRTVKYNDEILIRCPTGVEGIKEFMQSDDVDVWHITSDGMADIRIKKDLIQGTGIYKETTKECITIASIEDLVHQFEVNSTRNQVGDDLWFEDYHDYEEIYEWYKDLAEEHREICRFVSSIGESLEGRAQPAVHIGIETGQEKLKIYFQCQIHAREWISGATCMYMANYLVTSSTEERVKAILEKVEFIFVPFVNPDGYEYSRNSDRLWRKNRSVNEGSSCRGVDLNRNYNEHWSEGGSSSNPCSETYHGTGPASEPETQNTQNYFRANAPIIGAIDWHSYSQLIMRPYGWTNEDSPDDAAMKEVGDAVSAAIYEVHGKTYTSQKKIGLYPTSGTASDWCYGEDASSTNKGYRAAGYSFELRDTGQYGFLLPPDQIIPTGEENAAGALVFAEMLADNPLKYEK